MLRLIPEPDDKLLTQGGFGHPTNRRVPGAPPEPEDPRKDAYKPIPGQPGWSINAKGQKAYDGAAAAAEHDRKMREKEAAERERKARAQEDAALFQAAEQQRDWWEQLHRLFSDCRGMVARKQLWVVSETITEDAKIELSCDLHPTTDGVHPDWNEVQQRLREAHFADLMPPRHRHRQVLLERVFQDYFNEVRLRFSDHSVFHPRLEKGLQLGAYQESFGRPLIAAGGAPLLGALGVCLYIGYATKEVLAAAVASLDAELPLCIPLWFSDGEHEITRVERRP